MNVQTWSAATIALAAVMLADQGAGQSRSLKVDTTGVTATTDAASVAGQVYKAERGQSTEIILPDGTLAVIGSGGTLRTDAYEWNGQSGRAVLRLSPGTYRISAGALGRGGQLTVLAGATRILVEGATAVIAVQSDKTVTTYMTLGGRVTVSGPRNCTRRLSRTGFETTSLTGGCPKRATKVSNTRVTADRRALRPALTVVASAPRRAVRQDDDGGLFVPASATEEQPNVVAPQTTEIEPADPNTRFTDVEPDTNLPDEQSEPPLEFALNLAPGIGVPAAASPNLTGSPVTSTDGRFAILDNPLVAGIPDLPDNLTEAIGPAIFDATRAGFLFFSNSDLQPVTLDFSSASGDFLSDLRFVSTLSELTLFPFERFEPVTIRNAIAQERAGFEGDVVDYYIRTFSTNDDTFSFLTLDLEDAGVTLDTVIGEEAFIDYTPLPTGTTSFQRLSAPFDDKVAVGFIRADEDLSSGDEVWDGFVLYHTTDALAGGGPDPNGQSDIFAVGRVSETSNAYRDFRVERYAATFGLFDLLASDDVPWDGYQPKRALLPDISRQPEANQDSRIDLNDAGIYMVYRPQDSNDPFGTIAQVAHADLGFSGQAGAQRSTLSIATGSVRRGLTEAQDQFQQDVDALDYVLDIHSLGTLRNSPAGVGSVLVSSPLTSLAFGGNNENLADENNNPEPGLAGYYLIATDPTTAAGATIRPVNPNADAATFQTVRFLRATGTVVDDAGVFDARGAGPRPEFEPAGRNDAMDLTGFAAGLAEVQQLPDTLSIASRTSDTFRLVTRPGDNRLQVDLTFASGPDPIVMGGLSSTDAAPLSTYIDRNRFAARSEIGPSGLGFALASSALVLGTPVETDGRVTRPLVGLGSAEGTRIQDYQHVKWGVFLGDRIADGVTGQREHMHIGTWVAGDPVDVAQYADFTGTAEYNGHAIGNAFDGQSVYTAVGTYSNTWTFGGGSGSGTVTMTFDGATYTGATSLRATGGFESTDLTAPGRQGTLDGDFFGGVSTVGETRAPNALGGQFDISNEPGAGTYQATGTFAADKQ